MPSRRTLLAATLGAGLVVTRQLVANSGATGFISPPRGASYTSSAALRGADRSVVPAAAASRSSDSSSSGLLWLPLLGIAFAGISNGIRRREADVSCSARHRNRYAAKFGGDGPPKTPQWLTQQYQPGTMVDGVEQPAWLTLQKWESFNAKNRARDMHWWVQTHDADGFKCFDHLKEFTIAEAVDLQLQMNARAPYPFNPSIEAHMVMNLNSRYPDQQIRTSITLPHGTGKEVKIAVFCTDEEAEDVQAAGADFFGSKLADDIAKDIIEFDVLLAKPQMMPKLAKLGKILGPKRLMPSPKSGTVVTDYKKAIDDFKTGGLIELRMDKYARVSCGCGRLSFGRDQLIENFREMLKEIAAKRPEGARKNYWRKVYLGSSAAPSIRIKASEFPEVVLPKKKKKAD